MDEQAEDKRKRRTLRAVLTLGVTVVATAAIGFGGLAAWQAYTENDNSHISAGSLTHTNVANGGVTCNSVTSLPMSTPCQLIFTANNIKPGQGPFTGTVKITNTGSLQSSFTLATTAAGSDPFCADLALTVTDSNGTPITYVNSVPLSSAIAATSLKTQATTPSLNWNTGDNNTFTFSVALTNQTNSADEGHTCAVNYLFTQTNT